MTTVATIPNVFHFVFGLREQTEPFHLMYYLCLVSCIEVNQPDEVHFHYHHEPHGPWWERIKPRLRLRKIDPEQFVTDYKYADPKVAAFRYAHLADFARLRILHEEGGIYADIDSLFLCPLPSAWRLRAFILGEERAPAGATEGRSLCNAWIASAPGSAFCRYWLDGMEQAFDGSWSNHSTLLPYRLSQQYPTLVDIQPPTSFYALDWTPQGIDDLLLRQVSLPEKAYSLHLWNHLWGAAERLDFSRFHAGLLTVEYVAFASTTYARNARRFLPVDVTPSWWAYQGQRARALLRYQLHRVSTWVARR
jgi:hypothetical protein